MTLYRTSGLIIWSSVELYFIKVFYEREVSIFWRDICVSKFYERVISIDNRIGGMLNVREVSIFWPRHLCFKILWKSIWRTSRIWQPVFGSFGKTFAKIFAPRSALARGAPWDIRSPWDMRSPKEIRERYARGGGRRSSQSFLTHISSSHCGVVDKTADCCA